SDHHWMLLWRCGGTAVTMNVLLTCYRGRCNAACEAVTKQFPPNCGSTQTSLPPIIYRIALTSTADWEPGNVQSHWNNQRAKLRRLYVILAGLLKRSRFRSAVKPFTVCKRGNDLCDTGTIGFLVASGLLAAKLAKYLDEASIGDDCSCGSRTERSIPRPGAYQGHCNHEYVDLKVICFCSDCISLQLWALAGEWQAAKY
ncbi:hypothetical protein J6590_037433, partial [Homalodisca vitripennis]